MLDHSAPDPNRSTAVWLGAGGLLPFVFLACAGLGSRTFEAVSGRALFAYGAVILSFVGALHWAFAMTLPGLSTRRRNESFVWSVVPALLAWIALLLSAPPASGLMIVGFAAQYAQDRRLATRAALPAWYLPLRARLTAVACVCLAIGGATPTIVAALQRQ